MLEPNEEEKTEGAVGGGGQNSKAGGLAEGGRPLLIVSRRGETLLLTFVT